MKEFRVAKCLSDDGRRIRKYVIFKDGSRKKTVLEDDEAREYFEVDNWINSDLEIIEFNYHSKIAIDRMRLAFTGRVSDMVESIRRGYGDVIVIKNLPFGIRVEKVLYFLDREYGENLRQKSLEGWKDTVFKYVLYYNNNLIDKTTLKCVYDRSVSDVYFDTTKEAIDLVNRIIDDTLANCMYFMGKTFSNMDENKNEISEKLVKYMTSDIISESLVFGILELNEGQPIFLDPNKGTRKYMASLFDIRQDVER